LFFLRQKGLNPIPKHNIHDHADRNFIHAQTSTLWLQSNFGRFSDKTKAWNLG